jgi:uncharacterized membrane protein YhaH (DUF805 family)
MFCVIVGFVIGLIGGIFAAILGVKVVGTLLRLLFELAILIPSIAVGVRRLHDLDKSGWWLFLSFVPLVGGIILLVWFCTPGTRGPNRFGGGNSFVSTGPMPMPVGFN